MASNPFLMRVPGDLGSEVARAMEEDGVRNKSAYWRHAMRQLLDARRVHGPHSAPTSQPAELTKETLGNRSADARPSDTVSRV